MKRRTPKKSFKITYNEGFRYNITTIVKADNPKDALVKFNLEHPNNNEIVKIEEVE